MAQSDDGTITDRRGMMEWPPTRALMAKGDAMLGALSDDPGLPILTDAELHGMAAIHISRFTVYLLINGRGNACFDKSASLRAASIRLTVADNQVKAQKYLAQAGSKLRRYLGNAL